MAGAKDRKSRKILLMLILALLAAATTCERHSVWDVIDPNSDPKIWELLTKALFSKQVMIGNKMAMVFDMELGQMQRIGGHTRYKIMFTTVMSSCSPPSYQYNYGYDDFVRNCYALYYQANRRCWGIVTDDPALRDSDRYEELYCTSVLTGLRIPKNQ
nr:uncharacterized protein LOC129385933 isoform X2 [Dermacentor andersoni]